MIPRLDADIKTALLSGDKETARSLSFIKSNLQLAAKNSGIESLDEQQTIDFLRREVKKRNEAAEFFDKGGKPESAAKERWEADLIRGYMPAEMNEDQVSQKLEQIIATNSLPAEPASMGKLMSLAKAELGSSADPSLIAKLARELLNK